ncbi:hypothetical protein [Vibrio scophthalmi]|nr:hypothetical protein [Vibrio scophthalmi]
MMKKITVVSSGEGFYDDGSSSEALERDFQSTVYSSFKDFMDDMYWMGKNENFRMELAHITESNKPRRTPEERQHILINKINAKRRLDEHCAKGGTSFEWGIHPELNKKKASH